MYKFNIEFRMVSGSVHRQNSEVKDSTIKDKGHESFDEYKKGLIEVFSKATYSRHFFTLRSGENILTKNIESIDITNVVYENE